VHNYTVFIDESGNAGSNLLDPHPIFTLAAVAADDAHVASIDGDLLAAFERGGLRPGGELKAAQAIAANNHALIHEVMEVVFSAGEPIFWSVLERRFMIAGIIVDTFYDHVYNDAVGPEWTYPSEERQNLANHFYARLSAPTLALAAKSLVVGDPHGIRALLEAMQQELAEHRHVGSFDAVAALSGAYPHVDDLANVLASTYRRDPSDPLAAHRGTVRSPNITLFFELLNRVEDHYRGRSPARVRAVFDSSGQFDEAFAHLQQLLANSRDSELRFPGKPPILFGHRVVAGFSPADSRAHRLLQVADLFAGGIRSVFDLFASPNQPPAIPESLHLFLGFIAINLRTPLFNYVISDSLISRIWPTIERYA
jgi:hypothetical protein